MACLQLRGTTLGDVDAVLFDKDGTLSISEPQLLTLSTARVFLCLEQPVGVLPAIVLPDLQQLLERAYGLHAAAICPAGITAVASRDHNLIATATALVQVGMGWPEALALSEQVFLEADQLDARRTTDHAAATSSTTEGLRHLLEQLHAAGVLCAVISNDDMAGIEHFLASHQLGAFFSGLWSAEHRPRKPDPAAVHGLCDQLGVRASRCAMPAVSINTIFLADSSSRRSSSEARSCAVCTGTPRMRP